MKGRLHFGQVTEYLPGFPLFTLTVAWQFGQVTGIARAPLLLQDSASK